MRSLRRADESIGKMALPASFTILLMQSEDSRHRCLIYDGPPSVHLPIITAAIIERLEARHRCLYLNSPAMVAGIRTYLSVGGIDVARCVAEGTLLLSAEDNLVNGKFDIDATLATFERLVRDALADGYAGLFASGDMLWEFGSERNLDKLLDYEIRLDKFLRTTPALSGICQYHRDLLPASALQTALYTHENVYVNNTLALLNPHYANPATLVQQPNTRFSSS